MKFVDSLSGITEIVIGAAMRVHRELGPGLLESAYEPCLVYELVEEGLRVERQKPLPVLYKGVNLDCGYRLDLVVENKIILELKAAEKILPVHEAQVLSYLKLSGYRLGFLINFHVDVLKNGIRRFVNQY
jgi:GxxExxY protein